jgi:SPP1 gp7 family putative phage head morphogenesis protein
MTAQAKRQTLERGDPVHKTPGGFKFGETGKTYRSKKKAEAQARAIYATGWKQDRKGRAKIHRALTASSAAEANYVLAIQRIMGAIHRGVLAVVHREHLKIHTSESAERLHGDADKPDNTTVKVGLGDELLRRMFKYVVPQTQEAFDKMSAEISKKADPALRAVLLRDLKKRFTEKQALMGIERPAALKSMIDRARDENVALIKAASFDFLEEIKDVLKENIDKPAMTIAKALQDRVSVSQSRAQLIARDQTLKANAALAHHRMRAAGVERYRWSGSLDARERPMHLELEGQVFSFDDPPETNEDGDRNNPGEDYQCRCVAIPIIEGLDDEPEEEGETGGEEEPDEEPDTEETEETDRADFDPDQPRDEHGRFGSGGFGGATKGRATPFGRVTTKGGQPGKAPEPARTLEPGDLPWRGEPGWTPGSGELSRENFRRFEGSEGAALQPDDIVDGFRHEGVAAWLKDPENRPSLSVHQVFSDGTQDAQSTRGYYQNDRETPMGDIVINSNNAELREAEKGLPYGQTWSMSARALGVSNRESAQTTFAHEFGHHLEMSGRVERLNPTPAEEKRAATAREAAAIVDAAYARTGIGETISRISVLQGDTKSPAVSRYALSNPHEYFAESFACYIVDRKGLKEHDFNGYRMVQDVLKARGIDP